MLRTSRFGAGVKHWLKRRDESLFILRRVFGVPRRPAVLFEVYNTFGFDAQEPVIHELAERGLVDVQVSGGAERGLAPHRIAELTRRGVKVIPLDASRHRRFDAVVITDSRLVNSWRSSHYVFLHHGSAHGNRPDPYAFEMLECGDVDFLLALTPHEAHEAHARFGKRLDGRVRVVGQPKLDRLVHTTPTSRAWLELQGLDPERRTILVLSHWTPTSLLHSWGDEILRLLRLRTEFNVLVTGHHHLWDHPARSGGVDWRARLGWIADEPHMRLFPKPEDLLALMTAADLAVTDHTSATAEYALLNRPLVLFRHPAYLFCDPEYDRLLRRTSSVFSHVSEFPRAFEEALKLEQVDQPRRGELLDYCFSHLGDSSRVAALAIDEIARCGTLADVVGPEARD